MLMSRGDFMKIGDEVFVEGHSYRVIDILIDNEKNAVIVYEFLI